MGNYISNNECDYIGEHTMVSTDEITINLLDIVNNMNVTKEQKEDVLLQIMNVTREDGHFDYEDDNIVSFTFNKCMESLHMTVEIDPDVQYEKGNKDD